jgi:hypothetical protein
MNNKKYRTVRTVLTFNLKMLKKQKPCIRQPLRYNFKIVKQINTVVSNYVNSDHVPSFPCLDV